MSEGEIFLLGPIKVNTELKCVDDTTHFTEPDYEGMSKEGGEMGLLGTSSFNIYTINSDGLAGNDNGYNPSGGRVSGGIKFGVTPCAEKIDIKVKRRNDKYGAGFDTLQISVDNNQIKKFESTADNSYYYDSEDDKYRPPLSACNKINETVTHDFEEPKVCGHIVHISGTSGSLANNDVGYDVKITVTLR